MSGESWPWIALLLLGALHGLNPGMGWLFAVALGLQRGERRAVWSAVLPLTLGHALAIGAAVVLASGLGLMVPPTALRWGVIAALVILGVRQLRRHAHPVIGGMRMRWRDLVLWSFLVATAHGAGLMALPLASSAEVPPSLSHDTHTEPALARVSPSASPPVNVGADGEHGGHRSHATLPVSISRQAVAATVVHTLGYVLVTAFLAMLVYDRVGLRILRHAWINLDVLWAGALLLTAVALAVL